VLLAHVVVKHAQHRTTLIVADSVEYFVYFLCARDGHVDGVASLEPVELEGLEHDAGDELVHVLELGLELVGAKRLDPGGERLVEPEVVPPLQSDLVAEPHVGQFVADHGGHPVLLLDRGVGGDQQIHLPLGDQAPVLHGARLKLGNGDVVGLGQRLLAPEPLFLQLQGPFGAV